MSAFPRPPVPPPAGGPNVPMQPMGTYTSPQPPPVPTPTSPSKNLDGYQLMQDSDEQLAESMKRISSLEKKYSIVLVIAIVFLLLLLAMIGGSVYIFMNHWPAASSSNGSTSTGSSAGASTGSVSTNPAAGATGSVAAAAFTPTQWKVLNQTVLSKRGPPGRDGKSGKDGRAGPRGRAGRDGKQGICMGVMGANETVVPGGYFGWFWRGSQAAFRHMYPLADVYAKVGDTIAFRGPHTSYQNYPANINNIWDDVAQFFNATAWELCDFSSNDTALRRLAFYQDLRQLGGFKYKLQPQHANKTLYFASMRGFTNANPNVRYCNRGIKVRVHVAPRLELPMTGVAGQAADSQTVLKLRNAVSQLSRAAVLNQLQFEQRVRSEGSSGLTDVRGRSQGIKTYNDGGFSNGAIASIHNHADFLRTVGIGEIQGVLNGVEFQTRHNDYLIRMPSKTSKRYGLTENIPFPDVPPAVLSKATVPEQVAEMQQWFKAFQTQDISTRDYRPYFKPILCYLEGTWIKATTDLTDPFLSERHQIDAKTWRELNDKILFFSNTGRKNLLENVAYLPNAVRDLLNDTYPIFANWEYRILCHPLKDDLPLQRLRVASDLMVQLRSSPITRKELETSRAARFEVNTKTRGADPMYPNINQGKQSSISWSDGPRQWDFLDYLMEQIPGKDNYPAMMRDTLAGNTSMAYHFWQNRGPLNAGYYSRFYSVRGNDAMGTQKHRRGYHDQYLWAAANSQDRVSGVGYTDEVSIDPACTARSCPKHTARALSKWSYAVPMEIIYLTPLTKWNPYNIPERARRSDVTNGGRTGSCANNMDATKAFNGWHPSGQAFFTPASFFGSGVNGGGAGDTVSAADSCALDANGVVRRVRASGHWITFPSIGGGVGVLRQRYPIMPIHEMGSDSFKELKALQELTLPSNYDTINTGYFGDSRDLRFAFYIEIIGGGHQHFIRINPSMLRQWRNPNGQFDTTGTLVLTANSDIRNGHEHTVELTRTLDNNGVWHYAIKACKRVGSGLAFNPGSCRDGHGEAIRST